MSAATVRVGLLAALGLCAAGAIVATLAAAQPLPLGQWALYVLEQQRAFHRALTQDLKTLAAEGGWAAGWGLASASFLYGVFHAAGPGHGKAVLSAYLLTHRQNVARGVWLAVAAAACQGLTAAALVYGVILAAGLLPSESAAAMAWSERLSYLLILAVGLLLTARAGRRIARRLARPGAAAGGHSGHHGHDHHDHDHCGHAHGPSAEEIARAGGARAMAGLILSIGLRPCSGAVLVLAFASAMSLDWAGLGAVAAMSLGTALATASLAILAVTARQWAASLAAAQSRGYGLAAELAPLAGGLIVLALGASLLLGSFATAARHPLGLS